MNIKSFILPAIIVVLIAGYIIYRQFAGTPASQAPVVTNNQSSTTNQTATTTPNNNVGSTTPPTTQSGYKDGQYTGQVASTVYGDTQVQVTISGGKITAITMAKTPTGPGHTAQLVASSFPVLISEAIAAQSSQVNVVSGATQNSQAFSQSLASALSLAG